MKNWLKLIISLVLVSAVSYLGSLATINSIPTWYATLSKPSFQPPNWIFGPVWTILYLMIAVSLFLVWKNNKAKPTLKKKAYTIFSVQLFLNMLWSMIFFGAHEILSALVIVVLLWLAIIMNILAFYKISKSAGWLLVPYLLWVSFASILNFAVWMLNK